MPKLDSDPRALALWLGLAACWLAACGAKQNDVGYAGVGGASASTSTGGTALSGAATGGTALSGASTGGAAQGGASSSAGGGGKQALAAGAGGDALAGATTTGGAETAGQGGLDPGGASAGGAGSATCNIGCRNLCEGGLCMCACPSTELTCWATTTALTFRSDCAADADCFVAEHYRGCCNVQATGLNVATQASFTQFEATTCGGTPPCGCAIDRLTLDDGTMFLRNSATTYDVRCVEGACQSFTP